MEKFNDGFIQNSFSSQEQGSLYLVATPIGNLGDMTARAIEVLKDVDMIAAEDTRQTRKLLSAFDIHTKLVSYHEHNKEQQGQYLLEQLQAGSNIAIVSDAGLPGISDPGADIADLAISASIPVIPIPGASASLTALTASGINTDRFVFYGFLNRQRSKRKKELEGLKALPYTLIFYESPHRVKDCLTDMHLVLGDRRVSIGRELTKKFEQFIRGKITFCLEALEQQKLLGEFTIVVEGISKEELEQVLTNNQWWEGQSITEHVENYISQGNSSKEAIKLAANDRSLPKRDVYQEYHSLNDNNS
ncbi:16S rRNA (cytidine(1402)-2'-O)-methyltransferase [Desulfuribacillus alkaliarsenatis]|uniref:Ribosomal RNA small subunit methyltransferase I n=1 Tax=Desulfuribacillus alkaliarsenatis TaxID=766136 RepID=A0A1E5FYU1_9FIRM|nr:16S rRNA (cytidine(1402)-2'-O)-methyltransferase [Desulfuribacillus alkaliarsenatis]OEF95742.1 16S rRNA (cytidine(1402)-2'-O)-methyltransferase [Desulfuribacillus alkaliarsenatis]